MALLTLDVIFMSRGIAVLIPHHFELYAQVDHHLVTRNTEFGLIYGLELNGLVVNFCSPFTRLGGDAVFAFLLKNFFQA
ncbi:MAG TPA: hypothetical protein DCF45_11915 [Gammaproteobacteria bacterium]|nr:hypothetical protein [Gammaproteobacteria bacterium]